MKTLALWKTSIHVVLILSLVFSATGAQAKEGVSDVVAERNAKQAYLEKFARQIAKHEAMANSQEIVADLAESARHADAVKISAEFANRLDLGLQELARMDKDEIVAMERVQYQALVSSRSLVLYFTINSTPEFLKEMFLDGRRGHEGDISAAWPIALLLAPIPIAFMLAVDAFLFPFVFIPSLFVPGAYE